MHRGPGGHAGGLRTQPSAATPPQCPSRGASSLDTPVRRGAPRESSLGYQSGTPTNPQCFLVGLPATHGGGLRAAHQLSYSCSSELCRNSAKVFRNYIGTSQLTSWNYTNKTAGKRGQAGTCGTVFGLQRNTHMHTATTTPKVEKIHIHKHTHPCQVEGSLYRHSIALTLTLYCHSIAARYTIPSVTIIIAYRHSIPSL